jgi:hypothetical protein
MIMITGLRGTAFVILLAVIVVLMFSFSNFCCFTFMSLSHSARHLSGNCRTKDGSLAQALPGCRATAVDTRTTGTYENCHQNTLRNINTTTVTADRTNALMVWQCSDI